MARWVQVPSTHPPIQLSSPQTPCDFPPPCWQFPLYALINWKQKRKTLGWGGFAGVVTSMSCPHSAVKTATQQHKLCRSLPSQNRAIKVGRQQVRGGVGKRQNQMLTISIIISEPAQNTQPRHANYWRFAVRFVSFPHLNLVYQIQVDAWFSHFKILIVYRTNLKIKFPTGYNWWLVW